MGCEIVDQVMEEMIGTGSDLFGTTDIFEIFERLNRPLTALPQPGGDARARPTGRRRRRGGGAQVVRHRPRRGLHGGRRPRGGGSGHGQRVLHARRHRRLAAGDLLPQHVPAREPPPLRGRGHRLPRGGPGPSLPAHHRHGVEGPGAGPPGPRRHGLRGGLGPLQRAAGRRNGPLHRRPGPHGPLRRRLVAGQPARRRHRPARHGVVPPARRQLDGGPHAPPPPGGRDRNRPLHLVPRPGPGLHGGPARDRAPARRGDRTAGRALRPQGVPRPGAAGRHPPAARPGPHRRTLDRAPVP